MQANQVREASRCGGAGGRAHLDTRFWSYPGRPVACSPGRTHSSSTELSGASGVQSRIIAPDSSGSAKALGVALRGL